ncbi:MAG: type II CRISPR RNA-guided endonuclease Cas9 [Christensenellaceae bacterium]
MKLDSYTIGVDIGIGSVGFAVLDNNKNRIQDLGARIFESGETPADTIKRKSQKRRAFRSSRRLVRRRHHRKERLKNLFIRMELTTAEKLDDFFSHEYKRIKSKIALLGLQNEYQSKDIYVLRAIGIYHKLSMEELVAVLLHLCNHRGYNQFYDDDPEEKKKKDAEEKKIMAGKSIVQSIMKAGNYKTIGEMYAKDSTFHSINDDQNFRYIRNANKKNNSREEFYLALRTDIKEEAKMILEKQEEYYPQLKQHNQIVEGQKTIDKSLSERIFDIIFAQRDFEDGPGKPTNNQNQKYFGFKDTIGKCSFYSEENRGIRCSVIGDLFSTVNLLSQYTYIDNKTGEIISLPYKFACEIINSFIKNAAITISKVKTILKNGDISVSTAIEKADNFGKCNKFTNKVREIFEQNGLEWNDFAKNCELSNMAESKLQVLAKVLAFNITPARRRNELQKLSFLNEGVISNLCTKNKFGGTANASDKFMMESIIAFCNGEKYGDFQARKFDEKNAIITEKSEFVPLITDVNMIKNPVVFRSLNETRKIVNAIIRKYGTPDEIHIEVASDLNRSFLERSKLQKKIRDNEKNNDSIKENIASIKGCGVADISYKDVEKYKLYEQQSGRCLYSNEKIPSIQDVFANYSQYEIDHIIPYSLILDNTINNKCLVLRRENQNKGQRTPLQYFTEDGKIERAKDFKKRVNAMFAKSKNTSKKKVKDNEDGKQTSISAQKYAYLMIEDINSDEAKKLFEQWRSRNLNDTRYIAKYAVNMLSVVKTKKEKAVIPIKGGITAKFRNWWLYKGKCQIEIFDEMEKFLEHHRKKLSDMNKDFIAAQKELENTAEKSAEQKKHDKVKLAEIESAFLEQKKALFEEKAEEISKKYNTSKEYALNVFLNNMISKNREVSQLHHAVDAVIIAAVNKKFAELALDNNKLTEIWLGNGRNKTQEYWDYLNMCKNKMITYYYMNAEDVVQYLTNPKKIPCKYEYLKDEILIRTIDDNEELFKRLATECYQNKEFVQEISMPLVSAKPERKFSGAMTTENAVSEKAYTNTDYIKHISEKNTTRIAANKYYCTEVYEDIKGGCFIRTIRMIDIVKKDKKLYLRCGNPENYAKHIMYLFTNDFVEIVDKNGKIKRTGYFRFASIRLSGQQCIQMTYLNSPMKKGQSEVTLSVKGEDRVRKYDIDILGNKGGIIYSNVKGEEKCGVPLSLMTPTE